MMMRDEKKREDKSVKNLNFARSKRSKILSDFHAEGSAVTTLLERENINSTSYCYD